MSLHRTELLLFLLLWGTFAYFHHREPGWNVNSHIALTYAIVERGSARIDGYDSRPGLESDDVAVFGGHVYNGKIIGTSLVGVPAFAAVRAFELLRGQPLDLGLRRYAVTVLSVGLLGALAAVVFFRLLALYDTRWGLSHAAHGGSRRAALTLCMLTFLGTQLFFYSTLFMSYAPALFFALTALLVFEQGSANGTVPLRPRTAFVAGLLCGLSLLCMEHMGILVACFALYVLATTRRAGLVWPFGLGAALGIAPFVIYSLAIFGRLAIPYEYVRNEMFRTYMARGLMGATIPRIPVIILTTVHPYRGLFVHSPFLILGLAGLWVMVRDRASRLFGLFAAATAVLYLLFNSAYYMWWGGWSFGPRLLIPAIPLLAIPALPAWRHAAGRAALVLLGGISVGLHLVVNAVDPQFRDLNPVTPLRILLEPGLDHSYDWVFTRYIWRLFWQGHLDANAGQLMGITGPASLLPLLAWWLVLGAAAWRTAGGGRGQRGSTCGSNGALNEPMEHVGSVPTAGAE